MQMFMIACPLRPLFFWHRNHLAQGNGNSCRSRKICQVLCMNVSEYTSNKTAPQAARSLSQGAIKSSKACSIESTILVNHRPTTPQGKGPRGETPWNHGPLWCRPKQIRDPTRNQPTGRIPSLANDHFFPVLQAANLQKCCLQKPKNLPGAPRNTFRKQ